jgi:hypothetical protein
VQKTVSGLVVDQPPNWVQPLGHDAPENLQNESAPAETTVPLASVQFLLVCVLLTRRDVPSVDRNAPQVILFQLVMLALSAVYQVPLYAFMIIDCPVGQVGFDPIRTLV